MPDASRVAPRAVQRVVLGCLLAAGVVTVLAVGGGVLLSSPDDTSDSGTSAGAPASTPAPTPAAPTPTPLADYDTRTVTVQRAPFCDLVAPAAVETALGGAPTQQDDYGNGESAAVTKRVTDIAHEYGCGWSVAGASARAWVFAPPVTRGQARALVADAAGDEACTTLDGAPRFGSPSVAVLCRTDAGLRTSYRGLFGDAWLACSLQGPFGRDEAIARTGQLCVAVAQAAATPPA